jgi:hypothetical protein
MAYSAKGGLTLPGLALPGSKRSRSIWLPRVSARRSLHGWPLPTLFVAAAAILGGETTQGKWTDAIVQIASIPLLAAALWQIFSRELDLATRIALSIAAAIVVVPLLQLVPLPPIAWTALPIRSTVASAFDSAALPWMPISLMPDATWRAVLALLPPLATFLAVLVLGRRSRRVLTLMLLALAFVGVLLGLADFQDESIGFFVNRNHAAALLYSAIPFAAAWAVGLAADRRYEVLAASGLFLLTLVCLLLGLGMTRSRAGLVLAILAICGCLVLSWGARASMRQAAHRRLLMAFLIGGFLIVQFASLAILQRLQAALVADLRWEYAATTLHAGQEFLPLGSGVGSFIPVFRMFEAADQLRPIYANHAHNDYLELILEAGIPAVIVVSAFLAWFALSARKVWRASPERHVGMLDVSIARAATITITLLLLHSLVDYPLRTTTLSTLFALSCALLIPPLRRGPRRHRHASHHDSRATTSSTRRDPSTSTQTSTGGLPAQGVADGSR